MKFGRISKTGARGARPGNQACSSAPSSTSTNSSEPAATISLDHGVLAFQHGIGDATGVQADGAGRVVVTRDHEIHAFGRVVGIDHGDTGMPSLLASVMAILW